ncbi:uncharacterized protein DNG_04967 [Cephalotrichum gorgonifer]|uniref:FAR-17a/AIG1-like protein n=1 Tax=Cephalotrichum gorgonifer TaxID=2041049 RepID=A0AAE8SVD1_9PEZI|nr:uncharacterized protein DNG_04967 [Cephalotrichum gorgonifer]
MKLPTMGAVREAFSLGKDEWDPTSRFETSWLLPPFVLFAVRFIFFLYIIVTRIFIIVRTCQSEEGCRGVADEFSYFTLLTYWGLLFYFLVASVHTLTYALSGRPLLDRLPRALQALHSFYYTTVVTLPFLVTIVYWGILYEGPWYTVVYNGWREVSQHGMNSFFALFEILIPRTAPQPWVHVVYLIIVMALYLALAYITHATKGFYPYNFLDPGPDGPGGSGMVTAYVFIILAAVIIIFLLVKLLIWTRVLLTERKLGMKGKFSKRGAREQDKEMSAIGSRDAREQVGTSLLPLREGS